MADAVEQALLLPGDMADLRSMRKHEVFLNLKKDLALVSSLIAPFPLFHFFYTHTCAFLVLYSYSYIFSLTFVLLLP